METWMWRQECGGAEGVRWGTGAGAPHIHSKWARRVSQRQEVNGDRWTDMRRGPKRWVGPFSGPFCLSIVLFPKSGRGCVGGDRP